MTDVGEFRAEFKKLIEEADPSIAAVIVFVDDLDRSYRKRSSTF